MQNRGEQILARRRARIAASPAFLKGAFRPFFFAGAAWAIVALTLWLLSLAGAMSLPSAFDPLAWHRHEMLFGFVGAVVAGFLLTAISNWTGRLPIAGAPLGLLFALWLIARIALLCSATLGAFAASALDVGFYVVLAAVAGREVLAAKNRNVPIVILVLLFAIANGLDHAGAAGLVEEGLGWRFALGLVVVMISLVGGRIIPAFTRNWLAKRGVKDGLPAQPNRFDLAAIAVTGAGLLAWLAAPDGLLAGRLLLAAALFQAARLVRWGGHKAAADPLVLILHVGYAWVPIGLALIAASILGTAVPRSAGVHALTAGAMATMILAVMTRASLGHTGRALRASPQTAFLFVLVTAGALLRVAAPLGIIDYTLGMEFAAVAWAGAFLIFLFVYGPILLGPRPDEAS